MLIIVAGNNPLTLYLNQVSAQQAQEQDTRLNDPMAAYQQQQPQPLYNGTSASEFPTNGNVEAPLHHHKPSTNGFLNVTNGPTGPSHHAAASTSTLNVPRAQHSRAVSLP